MPIRLDVVGTRPNAIPPRLISDLHEIGFEAKCAPDFPAPEGAVAGSPVVLLADHQTDEKRLTAGGRPTRPSLGIALCRSRLAFLAHYCDEFLYWPSDQTELALRLERLAPETSSPTAEAMSPIFRKLNLIGRAPRFRRLLADIEKAARARAPILITGETGTGKELTARALHRLGMRWQRPFLAVNAAAIPETLIETTLFGHERGAFTDARRRHTGLVAQADGGVLFIDEVDCLSAKAQAVLLRFVQEHRFIPVGAECEQTADVQVIAATNADPVACVRDGRFREDLYYRLAVISLEVPSLRDRPGDAVLLARHYLAQIGREYGSDVRRLDAASLAWVEQYSWPGNVRELQSAIHRGIVFCDSRTVILDRATPEVASSCAAAALSDIHSAVREGDETHRVLFRRLERVYLTELMTNAGGNVSLAARRAGKDRHTLRRMLQRHGLERCSFAIRRDNGGGAS